jgi:HSP20 family protein
MADQEIQARDKQEVQPSAGEFTQEGAYFSPAVDIFGTEKELVLLADMPGVGLDQVEIDLRDNTLSIMGKVTPDTSEGKEALLTEYRSGNYFRFFRITEVVDQTKITASIADGVLKVVLPKVEKAVPRKIPIVSG